ncbi:nuclear transport factor 2 family protein [Haliangium ochraceum]|uniref:SnoaL-like domain-containing protein n=1 Tax=Haliangium ochraceum (strain DSM 14365 / JCM 11303 / SMP-2) TaxID=502025 RepID=D0LLP0_HALO1|nr:nuclear transport factor 2 family protein [Haliangium ochraceum]ACY13257.1 conserved hypothetical protein [Haliangium ochraceum DSM 14365]ACY13383.1 conserved hypothetical protein [Haliangium ochraceum DSM 14365]
MTIRLPDAIAAYFAADKNGDEQALCECFTQDAVVVDEGNTYTGKSAIRNWMAHASKQYSYTVEPFAISDVGGRTVVTSHLVGDFPGSPLNLRYAFVLRKGKIAELEIAP